MLSLSTSGPSIPRLCVLVTQSFEHYLTIIGLGFIICEMSEITEAAS